jgi:ribosome-associated protein
MRIGVVFSSRCYSQSTGGVGPGTSGFGGDRRGFWLELDSLGITPETLEVVEFAEFIIHHVDEDVEKVKHDPRGHPDSLGGEGANAVILPQSLRDLIDDGTQMRLALTCARLADNKKAENITLLDLREFSSVADYFVIVTGANEPHLRASVDEIAQRLRENYSIRPFSTEGVRVTPWVVLDLFDVLVHVMNDKFRELYDLEGLWGDAKRIEFEPEPSPVAAES